jgi:crotonobetainyl-CoA:carnitine CoA-transferase CaiB-like acyl-CoA transferase
LTAARDCQRSPQGRDALIRLVKTSDVFVTNFQSQLLEKFRLTWYDLRAANDRLIFALITAYGENGAAAD